MTLLTTDTLKSINIATDLARQSFLKNFHFTMNIIDQESTKSTHVEWVKPPVLVEESLDVLEAETSGSHLNIDPNDHMFKYLIAQGIDPIKAWLVIIAHESGHIILNHKCDQRNMNPWDSDSHLEIIGFDKIGRINETHKETAIEAYCDALMAKECIEQFDKELGFQIIEKIATLRKQTSKQLGFFETDDYATYPALFEMSHNKKIMDEKDAAKLCLLTLSKSFKGHATKLADQLRLFRESRKKKKTDPTQAEAEAEASHSSPPPKTKL